MNKDATQALFFQPDAEANLRRLVGLCLDAALGFLNPQGENKLHSDLNLPDLEALFHEVEIPARGLGVERALDQAIKRVVKHSVHVSDPHYIGHMTGATPCFHLGLELLVAALNQNVVGLGRIRPIAH